MAGQIPDKLLVSEVIKATGWNLPDCHQEPLNDVMRRGKTRVPFSTTWTYVTGPLWRLQVQLDPEYRLPASTGGAHLAVAITNEAAQEKLQSRDTLEPSLIFQRPWTSGMNLKLRLVETTAALADLTYDQIVEATVDQQELVNPVIE